jgi:LemA protein
MIWIAFIIACIILVILVIAYNRLVRDKHRVFSAWSDIDVQLKRRHDLIPKLVSAIQQYAAYEQSTLTHVTELRRQAENLQQATKRSGLENQLSQSLIKIFALAEDYPDLKSNQSYLDLQHQISEVERDIQFARRYYNGSVNNLNTRLETFPDLIVARMLNFSAAEYFEFMETVETS